MSFTFSVTLISGQAVVTTRYLPVQLSGAPTLVSGDVGWVSVDQYGNLKLASGTQVGLSGLAVAVPTTVSGNVFVINTSGSQFPSSPGIRHLVKLLISSVAFIAGAASVNSGTGYLLAGDPMTDLGAQMKVSVNNLNKLYGIALTSSPVTFLSFNF